MDDDDPSCDLIKSDEIYRVPINPNTDLPPSRRGAKLSRRNRYVSDFKSESSDYVDDGCSDDYSTYFDASEEHGDGDDEFDASSSSFGEYAIDAGSSSRSSYTSSSAATRVPVLPIIRNLEELQHPKMTEAKKSYKRYGCFTCLKYLLYACCAGLWCTKDYYTPYAAVRDFEKSQLLIAQEEANSRATTASMEFNNDDGSKMITIPYGDQQQNSESIQNNSKKRLRERKPCCGGHCFTPVQRSNDIWQIRAHMFTFLSALFIITCGSFYYLILTRNPWLVKEDTVTLSRNIGIGSLLSVSTIIMLAFTFNAWWRSCRCRYLPKFAMQSYESYQARSDLLEIGALNNGGFMSDHDTIFNHSPRLLPVISPSHIDVHDPPPVIERKAQVVGVLNFGEIKTSSSSATQQYEQVQQNGDGSISQQQSKKTTKNVLSLTQSIELPFTPRSHINSTPRSHASDNGMTILENASSGLIHFEDVKVVSQGINNLKEKQKRRNQEIAKKNKEILQSREDTPRRGEEDGGAGDNDDYNDISSSRWQAATTSSQNRQPISQDIAERDAHSMAREYFMMDSEEQDQRYGNGIDGVAYDSDQQTIEFMTSPNSSLLRTTVDIPILLDGNEAQISAIMLQTRMDHNLQQEKMKLSFKSSLCCCYQGDLYEEFYYE